MKSTLFSKSSRYTILVTILTVLFAVLAYQHNAFAQLPEPGSSLLPDGESGPLQQAGDLKTFWSLTKLGGGISVAIAAVFAIGIFLIVMQVYELTMDKIRSRGLLAINYRQLSVGEAGKLVKQHPNNYAGRLYSILLSIFHTTGNTRDFHDEIANYIELMQDRFGTFKSRLAFLSDTAGALGLLGTVWGMFATFFGGNLDSQRILNGMGLALVTTLIGLVVSIILNFFATEVFGIFNKRMELVAAKADEFRLWLMAIVHQRNKRNGSGSTPTSNGSDRKRQRETEKTPASGSDASPDSELSLKTISEFRQDGAIGHPLSDPITVYVESADGKRVTNAPVQFEVSDGNGLLDDHGPVAAVRTDERGVAKINWTLGQQVGPQRLKASIVDHADSAALEFVAFAQPQIPDLDIHDELRDPKTNRGAAS